MFLFAELLFKTKLLILMLKANQMFFQCFYDNTIKIILILAPGRECFRAKCFQFPLAFTE